MSGSFCDRRIRADITRRRRRILPRRILLDNDKYLFINAVDGYSEYGIFPLEVGVGIVIRKCDFHLYVISWMCSDELLFKIINVRTGSDHQISSLSVCITAVEFDTIDSAYVINVDSIAIFHCERCICGIRSLALRSVFSVAGFRTVCFCFRGGRSIFGGVEELAEAFKEQEIKEQENSGHEVIIENMNVEG